MCAAAPHSGLMFAVRMTLAHFRFVGKELAEIGRRAASATIQVKAKLALIWMAGAAARPADFASSLPTKPKSGPGHPNGEHQAG